MDRAGPAGLCNRRPETEARFSDRLGSGNAGVRRTALLDRHHVPVRATIVFSRRSLLAVIVRLSGALLGSLDGVDGRQNGNVPPGVSVFRRGRLGDARIYPDVSLLGFSLDASGRFSMAASSFNTDGVDHRRLWSLVSGGSGE